MPALSTLISAANFKFSFVLFAVLALFSFTCTCNPEHSLRQLKSETNGSHMAIRPTSSQQHADCRMHTGAQRLPLAINWLHRIMHTLTRCSAARLPLPPTSTACARWPAALKIGGSTPCAPCLQHSANVPSLRTSSQVLAGAAPAPCYAAAATLSANGPWGWQTL